MNILGITQGSNINIFLRLIDGLKSAGMDIEHVGAWVSFARSFKESTDVTSLGKDVDYLKEWEIVASSRTHKTNLDELRSFENTLKPGVLWGSLLADRRIIYGKNSKFFEDYRVHFSDKDLYAILDVARLEIEKMFDRLKPDAILGFTPVTFGEVLIAEIAKARKIPVLLLHSSRIRNYFAYHDVLLGTSQHFLDRIKANSFSTETLKIAKEILHEGREKGVIYEGVNLSLQKGKPFQPLKALRALPGAIRGDLRSHRDFEIRNDHHDPTHIRPWFYQYFLQPCRARKATKVLRKFDHFIKAGQLEDLGPYCFFPLHSEPEVALQVLGRPYHKNQFELLRNLASSLPIGYKLVVKEHPRSFGLRDPNFYERLAEIPNLYLLGVEVPSLPIVIHSKMVAVISSTIGLEAAMIGKPVLMLGHPKYAALPTRMARGCYDLFELPNSIHELLENYSYDEEGMICFLASLIEGSIDIDVYSVLLQKANRYSSGREEMSLVDKEKQDYDKLTQYTLSRLKEAVA